MDEIIDKIRKMDENFENLFRNYEEDLKKIEELRRYYEQH